MSVRVAVAGWKLRHAKSDGEYYAHMYDLTQAAHDKQANMLVLPELTCLEMLTLAPDLEAKDAPAFLVQFAPDIEGWLTRISASSGITLVSGAHFRHIGDHVGAACVAITPGGTRSVAYKKRLTSYERDVWMLEPGDGPARLSDARFAVHIGEDAEEDFEGSPGALLVPAMAKTQQSYERTRAACHAYARRGAYVAHASLVGALGYDPLPATFGSSAILAPGAEPAALAESLPGEEGLIVADLNLDEIDLPAAREPRA